MDKRNDDKANALGKNMLNIEVLGMTEKPSFAKGCLWGLVFSIPIWILVIALILIMQKLF